jgi:hypothetical protein
VPQSTTLLRRERLRQLPEAIASTSTLVLLLSNCCLSYNIKFINVNLYSKVRLAAGAHLHHDAATEGTAFTDGTFLCWVKHIWLFFL